MRRFRQLLRTRRRKAIAAAVVLALAGLWLSDLRSSLSTPRPSTLLVDRRGIHLGELSGENDTLGYWPPPYVIPERIVKATLETEDRRFFEHPGVSPSALARALWQDVTNLRVVSGGSTIAMQTARLQTPGRRTLLRKIKEAAEALLLVHRHGHERVLRQYLTLAPYGHRVRGVVRASRLYFDKPLEDLSWLQAAFLAGLPQAPGRMDPYDAEGLARATHRAQRILKALRERGVITDDELSQALAGDLGLVPRPHRPPEAIHAVLAFADGAPSGSPVVQTTLDMEIQSKVAGLLQENLARLEGADAGNSAALVLDTSDGAVLAWVGSKDYFDEASKGAVDFLRVRRSPGSALKPFVYALALESGRYTTASELEDTPLDLQSDDGRGFVPENFNHAFFGPMLLREALGNSRNIPALRLTADVGVEPVLSLLEKGGVRVAEKDRGRVGLGLAIGNLPVTPEELARLYLALARGGEAIPLRRFLAAPPPRPTRLLSDDTARLLTHVLSDPAARRPGFPAGGPLDFDVAVAVKTGTSQGFRDAWTAAFSDRLLVVVWVGNADGHRMNHVSGADAAATAAHAILDAVMPLRSPFRAVANEFPLPEHLLSRQVCALSGKLAGRHCPHAKAEWFVPGTEPSEACPWHHEVALDTRNGLRATPSCPARFVAAKVLLDLPERYAAWARAQRLPVAPLQPSPLCRGPGDEQASITLVEPRPKARYLWDPDTPPEAASIKLAARVFPADEPVVFLVDGIPVATVDWPHETRWPLSPGTHVITAALARQDVRSDPVRVIVDN